MGSQESKFGQPPQQNEHKESTINDSTPSTPILTPLDPRSPSVNIARTPLELILGTQTNEEPPDGAVKTDEDSVDLVLGIDPRSPTVEFNRTPIIVATVAKQKPAKLQNKNLDNVRKSLIQTTPGRFQKIPPKLLGSSPISVISNSNKRKSFVGLLETNIDFTETDLDSVCKNGLNKSLPIETENCTTPLTNKLKDQMDALQVGSETELGLVPVQTPDCDGTENGETNQNEQELKVDTTDITMEEKTINITAQVKDFDKKLTNLIYEDDSEDDKKFNLKAIKTKENNRTPLGVRNSNEEPKKAGSRLKVSDKPRKTDISKIPIFKDNQARKIGIQCENTPPKQMEEKRIKPKLSQWDGDKTLII